MTDFDFTFLLNTSSTSDLEIVKLAEKGVEHVSINTFTGDANKKYSGLAEETESSFALNWLHLAPDARC